MSLSKIVIIRRNSSGVITHRRFYNPRSAVIKREGSRGSDNMRFTLDGTSKVNERDEVYYLQDNVDVDDLVYICNFYGNFRDESGFEHDDYYTGNYDKPDCVNPVTQEQTDMLPQAGRFKGLYKPRIYTKGRSGQEIDGLKMHRRFREQNSSKAPIIDFSGDFDIFFNVRFNGFSSYHVTQTPCLYDFYDSTTSKGLRVEYDQPNTDLKITMNNGSSSDTVAEVNYTFATGTNYLIRVGRNDGTIKVQINKVDQTVSNSSYSGDMNNSNAYWYLFKKFTTSWVHSTGADLYPQQLRIYNRYLESEDAFKIWVAKPQALTMKFGGKVWKIRDGLEKEFEAKSHSHEILGTILSPKTFDGVPDPTNTDVARTGNVYTDGESQDVIGDILDQIGGDSFVHITKEPDSNPFNYSYSSVVAAGTFLQLIEALMLADNDYGAYYWNILPRKVLVIEHFLQSNYVADESHFRVIENGYDDTKLVNSLQVTGDLSPKKAYHSVTRGGQSGDHSWTVLAAVLAYETENSAMSTGDAVVDYVTSAYADGERMTEWTSSSDPSSSGTKYYYKFNDDKTKVQFWTISNSNKKFELNYVFRRFAVIGNGSGSIYWKKDQTSIDTYGLYERKINVPIFKPKNFANSNQTLVLSSFGDQYLERYKNISRRVRLESSTMLNGLNIGQKLRVSFITKKLYTSYNASTGAVVPLELPIKTIEWHYPESKTIVELGEHDWNSFDVETETIKSHQDLDTSTRNISS